MLITHIKKYSLGCLPLLVGSCANHNLNHPLTTGELTYSAFTWHYNSTKNTFEIYIADYLRIDSNGGFIGMRHDTFMDKAKYFSGLIDDPLRKRIDSVLSIGDYDRYFNFSGNAPGMYDGFIYSIDYRKRDSLRSLPFFIPRHSPPAIQYVQSALDSLIANAVPNSTDSFSFGGYKAKLEEKSIATGFKMPIVVPPKVELKNP
ncbi:MAG TPA: hypothetical protein VL978_07255 [Puia sp.]|nr:hypothetical protein [Puia sp.]